MNQPHDFAALREEYSAHGLRRADLDPDPIRQFGIWFTASLEAGIREVNAMVLSTVSEKNAPSSRVVLLKGFDADGFVFYTNYHSEKGRQLKASAACSLVFHWKELERQVRIDGSAKRVSHEESLRYFRSRPRGSQLGAWTSHQSEVIDARRVLDARLAEMTDKFEGKELPLPPNWGGYRVKASRMEFWQGRPNRLHDRFRYLRDGDGWRIERLAP